MAVEKDEVLRRDSFFMIQVRRHISYRNSPDDHYQTGVKCRFFRVNCCESTGYRRLQNMVDADKSAKISAIILIKKRK